MKTRVIELLETAKNKHIMIATAESCTGGMISAAITDIPGSSAIFDRGFVTYTNAAKAQMLGVKVATLETFGAVSEEVAAEMATGALAASHAQIAVSVTGIAGPGGSAHKPEGRTCFGLAIHGGCTTQTIDFGALGRDVVRQQVTKTALGMLQEAVNSFSIKI